jgi:hypothetical protein
MRGPEGRGEVVVCADEEEGVVEVFVLVGLLPTTPRTVGVREASERMFSSDEDEVAVDTRGSSPSAEWIACNAASMSDLF